MRQNNYCYAPNNRSWKHMRQNDRLEISSVVIYRMFYSTVE